MENMNENNFDISMLSENGQTAYQELLEANRFEDAIIGRGGDLSDQARKFNILLGETNADAAFKAILENGTIAGKLYALCGIYFTDHEHFKVEVVKYKDTNETIETISGCLVSKEKVSKIVTSNEGNTAIIKSGETLENFWKSNDLSYSLDIENGGYPATFRYFAEKERTENR